MEENMKKYLFGSLLSLGLFSSGLMAAPYQNGNNQNPGYNQTRGYNQTQGYQQNQVQGYNQSQYTQSPYPQGGKLQWYTNYEQALSAARSQNKPLVLFFTGSDWCGWCKKIDQEIFQTSDFSNEIGNNFIFVEVDFPMNKQLPANEQSQNGMLKQQFNVTGYPTIIVLDSNGNFIAETGYRPGGGKAYAQYLKQLVQQ